MTTVSEALELAAHHLGAGDLSYAEEVYGRVLAADPDNGDALRGLAVIANKRGVALVDQDRYAEAAAFFGQALRLCPGYAEAHGNRGNIFHLQGKPNEAVASYREALRHDPNHPGYHYCLGVVLLGQNDLTGAVAAFREALRLDPGHVQAHWSLALALLKQGAYEQAWAEYEWRWQLPSLRRRPPHGPRWDGSSPRGQTLLLWDEQGFGDTLMFVRYVSLVAELGARVILECEQSLVALLARCPGVSRTITRGEVIPSPYAAHFPLASLPGIFKTTPNRILANIPYLSADPVQASGWRQELGRAAELRIGITWRCKNRFAPDYLRSAPLSAFAPLADVRRVRLYSLQVGPGADALSVPFSITDLAGRFHSFADTAAALVNLDLVVTVDTAVAHLAGALGIPTWVALPYVPDWRWLLGREDSLWYPSLRLFRQPVPKAWGPVFERMAGALATGDGSA